MQLFLIGQISAEFNSRSLAGKPGRRRRQATAGPGSRVFRIIDARRGAQRLRLLSLVLTGAPTSPSLPQARFQWQNRPIRPEVSAIPVLMAQREEANGGNPIAWSRSGFS
jgi:hypothetical protein